MQRFTLNVNATTGAISNVQIQQTVILRDTGGTAFNGMAPATPGTLGRAFDPEGLVVAR